MGQYVKIGNIEGPGLENPRLDAADNLLIDRRVKGVVTTVNLGNVRGAGVENPRLFLGDLLIDQRIDGVATTLNLGSVKGDKGDVGTFSSASATTGAPGTSAAVSITGPQSARHVAFTIPRGAQGLPGVNAVPADQAVAGYISTVGASAVKSAIIDLALAIIRGEVIDPEAETGSWLASQFLSRERAHQYFVASTDVRRLITDSNARANLQPGDLLIQKPVRSTLTSFYKTPVASMPARWTKRWGTAAPTMLVAADPEASGGKVARFTTSTSRNFFSWDLPEALESADVEFLVRWRPSVAGTQLQVGMHGSGASGSENLHYFQIAADGKVQWWTLNNSVSGGGVGPTKAIPQAGEWWLYRARFHAGRIYFKAWRDGIDREPATWDADTPRTTNLAAGWFGLGAFGNGSADVDWVGVAFDGGIAPGMEI